MHTTLTHPAYAGAYVYGRTRDERYLGPDGALRTRRRMLPRDQWEVLIPDHHPGFTDWDTYLANQDRIGTNIRPQARQPGTGAVREGCALLQGLATCGTCGRKLAIFYRGPAKTVPNYYCQGSAELVDGRGARHMNVGGQAIDAAVADAFLAALAAGRAARLPARRRADRSTATTRRWTSTAARPSRPATTPPGPSAATAPSTRITGWSPAAWKLNGTPRCSELADAEAELARRQAARPKALTPAERAAILALGDDLGQVWDAPTTTDKDRKQLLRTLLDEVNITLRRDDPSPHADLIVRWKGGAISELTVPLRRRAAQDPHRRGHHRPDPPPGRALPRRGHRRDPQPAAPHAPPAECRSPPVESPHCAPTGTSPATSPAATPPAEGELLNVAQAARQLGIAPSTLLRWLNDGFIAGEQVTPGAPWRIRLTDELRGMLTDSTPDGWLALAPRHPRPRHLPPDRIAKGQARRAERRPHPHRTQERPAYRGTNPATRPVLNPTISKGAV